MENLIHGTAEARAGGLDGQRIDGGGDASVIPGLPPGVTSHVCRFPPVRRGSGRSRRGTVNMSLRIGDRPLSVICEHMDEIELGAPEDDAERITVNSAQTFKFDKLGPVVVNSDGVRRVMLAFSCRPNSRYLLQTLSRIANWESMTPAEKERTLRVLVARNK